MFVKEAITNFITGEVTLVEGEPPVLTMVDYTKAIDNHVEFVVRSKDYNSAAHIASYVASTVPLWRAEAETFIAWRDQVWLKAFQLMQELKEPPTVEEVIESLPKVRWPE